MEETTIIKVVIAAIFGVICCMGLSSCGFKIGSTVVGTSGFLQEYNAGKLIDKGYADLHTPKEKEKLARALNQDWRVAK